MQPIQHRFIQSTGVRLRVAEQGTGPLVVLCHGFPESWYSWRHQFDALAQAGYRVVAPDMRGYGQSDAPEAVSAYSLLHLVGDVVAVVQDIGAKQAVVVGHDWGAPVAWHTALMRPDLFCGVVALSVPFRGRPPALPTSMMPSDAQAQFYQLYFQPPGVAEQELSRDVRTTLSSLLYGVSGGAAQPRRALMVPHGGGWLSTMQIPASMPAWLSPEDLDLYVAEFERTGFRGGLNWYRNIDRNWELLAPYAGAKIRVPALFVAGERDPVIRGNAQELIDRMREHVPLLQDVLLLPGCGHWTQQERPQEVNAALLRFLATVRASHSA